MTLEITTTNLSSTLQTAKKLARLLNGGETIELAGDVGSGKTTFTKGLAEGLGCEDELTSPSFTISRSYKCKNNLLLDHYDFYRLQDAGIMTQEISESIADTKTITVVEWADIIEGVLPEERITISLDVLGEQQRKITINASEHIISELK